MKFDGDSIEPMVDPTRVLTAFCRRAFAPKIQLFFAISVSYFQLPLVGDLDWWFSGWGLFPIYLLQEPGVQILKPIQTANWFRDFEPTQFCWMLHSSACTTCRQAVAHEKRTWSPCSGPFCGKLPARSLRPFSGWVRKKTRWIESATLKLALKIGCPKLTRCFSTIFLGSLRVQVDLSTLEIITCPIS